ncbi:MAG TPA: 50S ribosomal protein L10 [Chthoniobacterales bacterium]|jgi:large subunit ribosomal protein L10
MRLEKKSIVADLSKSLNASPFLLVTDYAGLRVHQFSELRNRLAGVGAQCHVVKNSFLKKSATELGYPDFSDSLIGQTAIVTGEQDVCAAAKVLKTFTAEFQKPVVRLGVLDNALLSADEIKSLADLPSKEVLQATLLGVLLAPASKLVRTLNEPAASLARLLAAKAKQDGENSPAPEAPAAEASAPSEEAAPAAEAPAAEAPAA